MTIGVRTIPKKRQYQNKEKTEFFYGYKIHTIVEIKSELPISIIVEKANHHHSKFLDLFLCMQNSGSRLDLNQNILQIQQWMLHG
ncbi:MAG: transposase [Candidatus Micrarchaeia archaeon]